jgi:hypothetical protein
MSGEGFAVLENLEKGGFSKVEIDEYRKKKTLHLQQGGFSQTEIKDYWGIREPKTNIASEYWNNVVNTFKEPVKQVQKFNVESPEVTDPQNKMDQILADYQANKIDKKTFQSLMNEQNEKLSQLKKETTTEVLGITADDITSMPGKIKEGAVGEEFEFSKYWERGLSQSIFNLAYQYHTDGKLPDSFMQEEFADTGHIERAIQSFGTILPDLPIYVAGGAVGMLTTRNKTGAAASAGFTAGTI